MKFFETNRGLWLPVADIECLGRDSFSGDPFVTMKKSGEDHRIFEGTFQDLTTQQRPQPIITLPPGWRFRWKDNGEVQEAIAVSYYDGRGSDELEYVYTAGFRASAEEGELLAPGNK